MAKQDKIKKTVVNPQSVSAEVKLLSVFFSWQSDTTASIGRNAIRNALRKAAKDVERDTPGLRITIDEATRGVSGGINIANKIIEKIRAADILVADITTITPPGARRPCPNPNVSYELGFGVSELGWERTIPLFNTAKGIFPKDLPFDLQQSRTLTFSIKHSTKKSGSDGLQASLKIGLQEILKADPKRPAQLRGLRPETIKHDRDVRAIRWLLSTLHLPTLDDQILHLPDRIMPKTLWYLENFRSVAENSLFHISDPTLKEDVEKFGRSFNLAMSHSDQYDDTGHYYSFVSIGDRPLEPERQIAWDEVGRAAADMRHALNAILKRVRTAFVEVDIHETNRQAWNDYNKEMKPYRNRAAAGLQRKKATKKGLNSVAKSKTRKPKKSL